MPAPVTPSPLRLQLIKLLHTVIWAFFASCILAIPPLAWAGRFDDTLVLSCPLTSVAARYTDDRRDNFDIYLPAWLARYNKLVFGSLLAGGLLFTAARWLG